MTESDTKPTKTPPETESTASCPINEHANDLSAVDDRWTKHAWSTGSYQTIAPNYFSMGAALVEGTDVSSRDRVLDIGCGTGTVTITAGRRGARVTGIDVAPTMVERTRRNAQITGLDDVSVHEGNATALPFDANTFDVTLSNLGHMYGDPPAVATRELLRVTRPRGRIGFTAWTPTSLYPSMAGVVMTVLSPDDRPSFSAPPFLWGDPGPVRDRLGGAVENLEVETRTLHYPAVSPEQFWEQIATNSGLFIEVLEEIPRDEQADLRSRLVETIQSYFDDRTNAVELEYLLTTAEIIARK